MAGYTRDELRTAFELVENEEHWKNPINKELPATVDIEAIAVAVPFFTGTPANIIQHEKGYTVTADGYWCGPCGGA